TVGRDVGEETEVEVERCARREGGAARDGERAGDPRLERSDAATRAGRETDELDLLAAAGEDPLHGESRFGGRRLLERVRRALRQAEACDLDVARACPSRAGAGLSLAGPGHEEQVEREGQRVEILTNRPAGAGGDRERERVTRRALRVEDRLQ